MRRARFFGVELAAKICNGVFLERDGGISALLGTVVDQAVFADIQVSRSGTASPLVGSAFSDVVLKSVDASEAALFELLHLMINTPLVVLQRLQLPLTVMDDSDRRAESQFQRALPDGQCILRIAYAPADDR